LVPKTSPSSINIPKRPPGAELNGALNVVIAASLSFIEVFKNETEYLHAMITATQEKVIPAPGRHGMVYVDTCILAHSNEAEWQKFKADHTNEASWIVSWW